MSNGYVRTAPQKACPKCLAMVHAAKMDCPDCGHDFRVALMADKELAKLDSVGDTVQQCLPNNFSFVGISKLRDTQGTPMGYTLYTAISTKFNLGQPIIKYSLGELLTHCWTLALKGERKPGKPK